MKRRFAGALVGALVAGSISIAAPAQAQEPCTMGPVPQEELISLGNPIQVYAGRVPGYATAVALWGADHVACLVQYQVDCIEAAGPSLPLVEIDPDTLTISIYPDNALGDTECILHTQ